MSTEKEACPGSGGALFEARQHHSGDTLGKCPRCGRVLRPTSKSSRLRPHDQRGPNTAARDEVMDGLWNLSAPFEYLRAQRQAKK